MAYSKLSKFDIMFLNFLNSVWYDGWLYFNVFFIKKYIKIFIF
jgi:hypothetical protein